MKTLNRTFFRPTAVLPSLRVHIRQYRYRLLCLVAAVGVLLLTLPSQGQAQTAYPAFLDAYVNDYGQVLAAEDQVNVRARLEQFRAQTSIHAVLVTIHSIADYPTGDISIESFATNLFNRWGIGDAARNDGILILVAPGDRQVRIELGRSYAASYNQVAQAIIDTQMLPYFREGQISQGTIAGVKAVIERFDPNRPASSLSPNGSSQPLGFWETALTLGLVGLSAIVPFGFIAALIALIPGFFLLRRWQRRRQRQCPHCLTKMQRLDEQADDQYLEVGQRREEALKSVDYDVWLCSSCGYHTANPYTNFFSPYKTCSQCSHKTLQVETTTIVHPTYTHQGKAKVEEICQFCNHSHTFSKVLPKLVKSTTSSSSSSGSSHGGGGHSSGGGASGSW